MDRKIASPLARKEEFLDKNDITTEAIARRLNDLINKGVLTKESVEKANSDVLDEFLRRYKYQIVFGEFSAKDTEKIKTLLSSHQSEKMEKDCYPNKDEIICMAGDILKELREEFGNEYLNMIFIGSRMDSDKQPRNYPHYIYAEDDAGDYRVSDLDVLLTDGSEKIGIGDYEDISSYIRKIKHANFPQLDGIKIEINHIRPVADILEKMDKGYIELDDMPNWSWKSDAVRFIGDLTVPDGAPKMEGMLSGIRPGSVISEADVNSLLQLTLKSKQTENNRKLHLYSIRERLKELLELKKD